MAKVLYLKASPRGSRSHSLAVAEAFLASYREAHPLDEIITLDLFTAELPAFDGLTVTARYNIMHGRPHAPEEAAAWQAVEALISQFKGADKYVLATPMWNFSIPYRLKHYLDILVQPTYTFAYTPDQGYQGLVTGKPIFIAYARGGAYPAGAPREAFDLQSKYLQLILGFIGFSDIRYVTVEPTLEAGPEVARAKREKAIARAREMAKVF